MDERLTSLPMLSVGSIFRILVVDDDPACANLLQELMKNVKHRYELHFAQDGVEALDFLHRRGSHAAAPRPNLILLDVNMPRLGGLETLSAIKSHPELRMIPVIMLSASSAPYDVRESYQAQANCYVQKPTDLERSVKLVQAVEAFWTEFALPLVLDEQSPGNRQLPRKSHIGPPIAPPSVEARSRATRNDASPEEPLISSRRSGCDEHKRLLDEFGMAVRGLIELHEQQFQAIVDGDSECHRFDLLIHLANEKKQQAKYAYLRHVEEHGCLEI
jgi:chemotaxis family two-component system response regulator Rcp1